MSIRFIASKIKALENLTKGSGARMAEAGVPEVDTSGEGDRTAGGGGRPNRVQIAGAVTAVEKHPSTTILNRKTRSVKFHRNIVITSKRTNRNEVVNELRRNNDIS
jgi:hypothetical protein